MNAFKKNRTAKKIVQRLRFRSTSEPPPSGPVPLPTPNAPDKPESLPECISTKKIRTTAKMTCSTERTASTRQEYRVALAGCSQAPEKPRKPGNSATSRRSASGIATVPSSLVLMKTGPTITRAHDYESFTDSWLPADMNSVGVPRDCGLAAPT